MKQYSFVQLFRPSIQLVQELDKNQEEKSNWESQKQAAIAADTQGDRFKI